MTQIAVGLGSNVGDRFDHVVSAMEDLDRLGTVTARSSLYETAPIGNLEQDDFINAVAIVETDASARSVLDTLLEIEQEHGRTRTTERWGPRTLDLDLLVYGNEVISEPGLTVPHPHIAQRRFVLEPLAEIWPDAVIGDGVTARGSVEATLEQQVARVRRPEASEAEAVDVAGWQVFAVTMGLALAIWWLGDLIL